MGLDEPTPDAAEKMLKSVRDAGGRMVAVLPASAKGKEIVPNAQYHDVYDFAGTSIQVVLMTADKGANND